MNAEVQLAAPDKAATARASIRHPTAPALHWLAACVLLALGIWHLRPSVAGVDDVTWLITAAERLLDGHRLYIDIMELNPPASVWLYTPAVWLARGLGVRPEVVVDVQTMLVLAASPGFGAWILAGTSAFTKAKSIWLLAGSFAFLVFMPQNIFGQREIFVLAAMLPMLAVLVQRAEGMPVPWQIATLAGFFGGLGLAIKPVYALCFGLAWLAGIGRCRSGAAILRAAVRPEGLVCAAAVLAYLALVAIFMPRFFSFMVPLLTLAYLPAHMTWSELAMQPLLWLWLATFAAAMVLALGRFHGVVAIALAASLGAALAFAIQRKGFQDHAFPMLALAVAALAAMAFSGWRSKLEQMLAVAFLLASCTALWPMMQVQWDLGELRAALLRLPPHQRMLAVSQTLLLGHPLVRQVGGTWVGRWPAMMMHNLGLARRLRDMPDAQAMANIEHYEKIERDMLLEDIVDQRPDIVLVQIEGHDWSKWAANDPEIRAALAEYQDRGTFQGIRILRRGE